MPWVQLKKMDMESRSVAPDRSRVLTNKVKEYKADLASLKEQLNQAKASVSGGDAARAELVRSRLGAPVQRDNLRCRYVFLMHPLPPHPRPSLLAQGLSSDYASSSQAQRDRMLSASQRLEQTNDRLQQGKKLLIETEVGGEFVHLSWRWCTC